MKKNIDRQKFTTTLDKKTLRQLEEIKMNINNNLDKRIRGLNEVIEIITEEKWGKIINDKNSKKK